MTLHYSCPIAREEKQVITLAHGSGGKLTSQLIERIFLPAFANDKLSPLHDGALLEIPEGPLVFTTDSYVVQPLFFPGGDIGKLAVCGTLNDLAMCGARPLYLSCGFIIEEGFLQNDLVRIVASMQKEAALHGVEIVTGDTKVIERQTGKNLFINTSGIGTPLITQPIAPSRIQPGDHLIVSGDIGRHGMAIMAAREGLSFSSPLASDCMTLFPRVLALLEEKIEVHCLRDLTRGGLATALVELSESSQMDFQIWEDAIPVNDTVSSSCEILGFDPLYVACEGRLIVSVPKHESERTLQILKAFPEGETAQVIGQVGAKSKTPSALIKNGFEAERRLYRLVGEQLPRIC